MNARQSQSPETVVRAIRKNTRRKHSDEEKFRIVKEQGLPEGGKEASGGRYDP